MGILALLNRGTPIPSPQKEGGVDLTSTAAQIVLRFYQKENPSGGTRQASSHSPAGTTTSADNGASIAGSGERHGKASGLFRSWIKDNAKRSSPKNKNPLKNRRDDRCGRTNNQSTEIASSTAPTKSLQNIALQIRDSTNDSPCKPDIAQDVAMKMSSLVKIFHLQKHQDVLSKDNLWEQRVVFIHGRANFRDGDPLSLFLLDYLANPLPLYKTF